MVDAQGVAHCVELLAPLGSVRTRRMFGGHGFYLDGLFIALMAHDTLYLKADAASQPHFEAAGCQPFIYEGAGRSVRLSYWTAPADALESPALMAPWARLAVQAALTARATQPLRRKPAPAPAASRGRRAKPG